MFMPPYGGVNFPYKTNLNWIIEKIKSLESTTGNLSTAWEEFQKNFDSELDQTVKDQLTAWLNDGTLAELVEQTVTVAGYNFKKVLVYGDSFTEGYGLGNPQAENWAQQLMNFAGGGELLRYYNGGAGFINPGVNTDMNFMNDFNTRVWPKIQSQASQITTVIIQGGLNDGSQAIATEQNAVELFLQNIRSKFPAAKIMGVTSNYYQLPYSGTITGINDGFSMQGIPNTKYGWTVFYGRDYYLQTDKLHPNADGAKWLAAYVYKAMMLGETSADNMDYHTSIAGAGGITYRQLPMGILISGEVDLTGVSGKDIVIDNNVPYFAQSSLYQAIPMYSDAGPAFMVLNSKNLSIHYSTTPSSNGKNRFSSIVAIPFR